MNAIQEWQGSPQVIDKHGSVIHVPQALESLSSLWVKRLRNLPPSIRRVTEARLMAGGGGGGLARRFWETIACNYNSELWVVLKIRCLKCQSHGTSDKYREWRQPVREICYRQQARREKPSVPFGIRHGICCAGFGDFPVGFQSIFGPL